jgi:hypothetical protein
MTKDMGVYAERDRERPQRYDAASLHRVHTWIQDDLREWAYARPRGDAWEVDVPAFSITARDDNLERAFDRANTLLIDYFVDCVTAGRVSFEGSRRPSPLRRRFSYVLASAVAENIATLRRRPPTLRRTLVTARSLDLLRGPSARERLASLRRADGGGRRGG